jgi:protein-L-isoaspartate(D-aspartate) O-methyltransferase
MTTFEMTTFDQNDLLADSALHRRTMVDCQIRTFDVTDQGVIARFIEVPREIFLPAPVRDLAYSDGAIQVACPALDVTRQLLPPLVLARMIQGASVKPRDKILDIAAGTGYSTALLAGLGGEVTALEADPAFASLIDANLNTCRLSNARAASGPLAQGMAKNGPYDVIFINGAVEAELGALFGQLSAGGRLLAIQRFPDDPSGRASKAVRFEKIAGDISSRALFDASAALLKEFQKAPQFVF